MYDHSSLYYLDMIITEILMILMIFLPILLIRETYFLPILLLHSIHFKSVILDIHINIFNIISYFIFICGCGAPHSVLLGYSWLCLGLILRGV